MANLQPSSDARAHVQTWSVEATFILLNSRYILLFGCITIVVNFAPGIYGSYLQWCVDNMKTFETTLVAEEVYKLNQKILGFFPGLASPDDKWNDLICVLMRMSVPNIQEKYYPWLLRRSSDFSNVRRLSASLEDSKLVQNSKKARKDIVLTLLGQPDAKAKRKPIAKAKAQPRDKLMQQIVNETAESDGVVKFLSVQYDTRLAVNSALGDVRSLSCF